MDAFDFIQRIEGAGFTVAIARGNLAISPASNLNDRQREFIRSQKAELLSALRSSETSLDADGGNDLKPANDAPAPIMIECWTPRGDHRVVRADSEEHADWIREMNPPPATSDRVTCESCRHAAINAGIARCNVGVDSGLAIQGWWAADKHDCNQFRETKNC